MEYRIGGRKVSPSQFGRELEAAALKEAEDGGASSLHALVARSITKARRTSGAHDTEMKCAGSSTPAARSWRRRWSGH
jgi:hypothetical protein